MSPNIDLLAPLEMRMKASRILAANPELPYDLYVGAETRRIMNQMRIDHLTFWATMPDLKILHTLYVQVLPFVCLTAQRAKSLLRFLAECIVLVTQLKKGPDFLVLDYLGVPPHTAGMEIAFTALRICWNLTQRHYEGVQQVDFPVVTGVNLSELKLIVSRLEVMTKTRTGPAQRPYVQVPPAD
jgi:hypothetical protein